MANGTEDRKSEGNEFDESEYGIRLKDEDGTEYFINFEDLRRYREVITPGGEYDTPIKKKESEISKSQRVSLLPTSGSFSVFMR